MQKIIDISGNNVGINYTGLKNQGVSGAIIKIGQGSAVSTAFSTHYVDSVKNNFNIGGYWFAHTTSEKWDGEKDAQTVLKIIAGKKFDLPIYLDIEGKDSAGNGLPIEKADLSSISEQALKFIQTIEKAGFKSGLYTFAALYPRIITADLKKYPLWLAAWTNSPDIPTSYMYGQIMWQWGCFVPSAGGYAYGKECNGAIDGNLLYDDVTPVNSSVLERSFTEIKVVTTCDYSLRELPSYSSARECVIPVGAEVWVTKGSEAISDGKYTYRETRYGNYFGWSIVGV